MKQILWLVLCAVALLGGPAASPLAAAEAWQPIGPPGGTATNLVLHPRNPRILWAVTYGSGLFQSVDGGASWKVVEEVGFPYIVSLAVAPSDPDTLYVAAALAPFASSRVGVLRSSDGGRSWALVLDCALQPPPCCGCVPLSWASRLVVHPRDPRTVFAATSRGLFRSVDGGAFWRKTGLTGIVRTLAFDPGNPEIVHAGGGGVSRSTDGGLSWRPGEGIGAQQFINALAIDPANPRRIWAGGPDGVFLSTDGGAHWRRRASGLGDRSVSDLALSPVAGRGRPVVWAATSRGVFRSLDGGVTWLPVGLQVAQGRPVVALEAHPSRPGLLWAATGWPQLLGAGIYRTVDAGGTWRFSSRGFYAIPVAALAFDPVAPGVLWTGSAGFGVHRGTAGGAGWTWTQRNGIPRQEAPGVVDDLAIDPRAPETLWAAGVYGIHVTEDAGALWEDHSEGLFVPGYDQVTAPTHVIRLAPSDPAIAYTGTAVGLYKTVDAGAHWTRLDSLPYPDVWDVWIDPRDPQVVFVAAGDLWISRDGGGSWEQAPVSNPPTPVLTVAADPRNLDVLYAGGDAGVFRSTDNGRTWQSAATSPGRTLDLTVEPTGAVWALVGNGIFRSPDGLSGWTAVPGSAELIAPRQIEADPHDPGTVAVGTARGVYLWEGEE